MAPKVHFYHNAGEPLLLACELIGRACAQGRKLAVQLADHERARAFDRLLWTFDAGSFIPHALHDSALASRSAVVIGSVEASPRWPCHDILFNLTSTPEPASADFRLIVEIVGRSDAARQPARQRWLRYRAQGCELKAFDAERRIALPAS